MFGFKKLAPRAAETEVKPVEVTEDKLPEGCEFLAEGEFAEVSGGAYTMRSVAL